jgi:pimeloyl-ACP methyl ester carboxylesterase
VTGAASPERRTIGGVIPAPVPRDRGFATSSDGVKVAWYRYGSGEPRVLFVPTWNLVDARVVGHQVAAMEQHATVVTYDPRGAGASDRPVRGYDFPLHATDALAVMDATGVARASIVTASRGLNAAVLVATEHADRVARIAAIAPYMRLEPDPEAPDPARLEAWRTDWAGFIVPFMHLVFTETGSDALIAEMIAIGMEASPDVVATQESELDWVRPARLLGGVSCPTLIIHGEADAAVPVELAQQIAATLPNARLELIPAGGHRPDIRTPGSVAPLLASFLFGSDP